MGMTRGGHSANPTSDHASPNRARYFLKRSASLGCCLDCRVTANNSRPAADNFVKKQHATISRFEQASARRDRSREGTLPVTKQCRHRLLATDRGAIDFDELAGNELTLSLE